jgi:simple sugar transport system ATP-binding protein
MIPAVEFQGLNKSFHGVNANKDIHLKIRAGSIHAIIGENGAGKSTAMKLLYGTYQPDSGEIYLDGQLWGGRQKPWSSPSDAIHCGIGMVHQHFMLAEPHTVLDNILLGIENSSPYWRWLPSPLRPIERRKAREKLEKIANQYGLQVPLDAKVEDLSVGVQQRIEILKLLYRDAKILILDEPTAVLTPQETVELFENLKKLCHQGKTIIIITHKLKEVMSLAHRVTVFRAGTVVGEREIQDTNMGDLASLMVGRKVNLQGEVPPKPVLGTPVLELSDLTVQGNYHHKLQDLNFQVRAGEVVGIAGVEGNGQAELIQVLMHPREYHQRMAGSIRLFGKEIRDLTTAQIKNQKVGVIPDDRLRDALLLDRPVRENFLLGLQRNKPFNWNSLISYKELEQATQDAIQEYDIRPKSSEVRSGGMSGGNQQKLVIAREFRYSPRFVIAAQPTRGVDVGAIEFIHKRILRARAEGSGVLLISSELDEILALSDRILVMYEGKIVGEFARGEVSERVLGLRMGGSLNV